MKSYKTVALAVLGLWVGQATAGPSFFGGHYYELIMHPEGIDWNAAKSEAEGLTYLGAPGYLATITSADEDDFIMNNIIVAPSSPWVGGFQPPGSPEPGGGWEWVTGEPWSFSAWSTGEPNNLGDENALQKSSDLGWNDLNADTPLWGYVVEWDTGLVLWDVPTYYWRHGCGPTSGMMVLGYWDAHGHGNLIPGSNDWSSNQLQIEESIASKGDGDGRVTNPGTPGTGHVPDYAFFNGINDENEPDPEPDMSELNPGGAHADDCLADFMGTSRSSLNLKYGWTYAANPGDPDVGDGIQDYATFRGYSFDANYDGWIGTPSWDTFTREMQLGRPVVLFVDSTEGGDNEADHFVAAIGYRTTNGYEEYACWDTWSSSVHWERFRGLSSQYGWGIDGMHKVRPEGFSDTACVGLGGDWNDLSVWDGGVPTANHFVCVPTGSTVNVTSSEQGYFVTALGALGVQLNASLTTQELVVRGGEFNQVGAVTVQGQLCVFPSNGSPGLYQLIGSQSALQTSTCTVDGQFLHAGGTHTTAELRVGEIVDGGAYTMDLSTTLNAGATHVGYSTVGTFSQVGGTHTVSGSLHIGYEVGSDGTYELAGGSLSTNGTIVGENGQGTLRQSGGQHTVYSSCWLILGHSAGSEGTYDLSGDGQLSAYAMRVGDLGTGSFAQTDGASNATEFIYLAYEPGSVGSYELSGTGSVSAINEYIGRGGTATFRQTSATNTLSGNLYIARNAGCNGTYELSGTGQFSATSEYVGRAGAGTFVQTGGTNTVGDNLYLGRLASGSGTYNISAGSLSTKDFYVGYEGSGTLEITGPSAEICVSNLLRFGTDSTFAAAPGATIHMAGAAFENENTDPGALAGLANLTLIFEGGAAVVDDVEVAGEDLGPIPAGWPDNFVLGTLQLGGADPGRIRLVDNFDNQQDGPDNEAAYVDWIVLNPGAAIDFNSLNLYYRNGGDPKQLFHGDANLDGCVDGLDYVTWSNNYLTGDTWGEGDCNGDGVADGLDYVVWSNNYWSGCPGAPGPVPEPATLALLALGGLALIRRKRQ